MKKKAGKALQVVARGIRSHSAYAVPEQKTIQSLSTFSKPHAQHSAGQPIQHIHAIGPPYDLCKPEAYLSTPRQTR